MQTRDPARTPRNQNEIQDASTFENVLNTQNPCKTLHLLWKPFKADSEKKILSRRNIVYSVHKRFQNRLYNRLCPASRQERAPRPPGKPPPIPSKGSKPPPPPPKNMGASLAGAAAAVETARHTHTKMRVFGYSTGFGYNFRKASAPPPGKHSPMPSNESKLLDTDYRRVLRKVNVHFFCAEWRETGPTSLKRRAAFPPSSRRVACWIHHGLQRQDGDELPDREDHSFCTTSKERQRSGEGRTTENTRHRCEQISTKQDEKQTRFL